MIVKILPSAYQFAGIRYNEQKSQEGTCRLLHAHGFEGILVPAGKASAGEKRKYLEMHTSLNPRVKRKQFHAILSTKERTHSLEQLTEVAKAYMQQMGYSKAPFLIYGHTDTDHNHVHIVASRVDREGRKVNDSFEKKRSVEVLAKILEVDISLIADQTLRELLSYEFSTLAQFKMLLELEGYRHREKGGKLEIIKYGQTQHHLDLEKLTGRMQRFAPWPERKKWLSATIKRYIGQQPELIAQELSKENIQVHFYYGEGHGMPYGYIIIDRPYKQVLKGSSVYPLKRLLGLSQESEHPLGHQHVRAVLPILTPGQEEDSEEIKKQNKRKKRKR